MNNNTKTQLSESKIYQSLLSSFEKITDLRSKRGVRYKLKPLLILLFLSKLGGADTSAEIADWVSFRFARLKSLLKLEWERSPHEVTWKRILENGLEAEAVEKVFAQYFCQLSAPEKELYNLDGKTVCRVINEQSNKQLHLLALAECESSSVVEQTALAEGENEISAAKRLFEQAELKNKIVSGDAIFAQPRVVAPSSRKRRRVFVEVAS